MHTNHTEVPFTNLLCFHTFENELFIFGKWILIHVTWGVQCVCFEVLSY